MKKIYLWVLSVITFFAVLFGCAYHLYGLLGNKDKSNEMVSVSYDFDNIEIDPDELRILLLILYNF